MENPRAQRVKARGDRQCHRKQTARGFSQEMPRVRVKRRGKSPPPAQQCAGHEKPSAVQDKTGGRVSARFTKVDSLRVLVALAARASARAVGHSLSGEWREMIVTFRASGGDRIRLIASTNGASRGNPGRPHFFQHSTNDEWLNVGCSPMPLTARARGLLRQKVDPARPCSIHLTFPQTRRRLPRRGACLRG